MTSFTHCYHNILYTSARAKRGRESKASPPGGRDAMENNEREGSTRAFCDWGESTGGEPAEVVRGVWDFAAHGISVAEEISDAGSGRAVRGQPSSAARARAYGACGGGADRAVAARAPGLGSAQTASAAAAAGSGTADRDHSSGAVAPGLGAGAGSSSAGGATLRAGGTESAVADGLQESEGMASPGGSTFGAGRLQPLCGATGGDLEHARGSSAGAVGRRVSQPGLALGDADGPRDSVVERDRAAGLDAADSVADETKE